MVNIQSLNGFKYKYTLLLNQNAPQHLSLKINPINEKQ
jgi:hypothetical protein